MGQVEDQFTGKQGHYSRGAPAQCTEHCSTYKVQGQGSRVPELAGQLLEQHGGPTCVATQVQISIFAFIFLQFVNTLFLHLNCWKIVGNSAKGAHLNIFGNCHCVTFLQY